MGLYSTSSGTRESLSVEKGVLRSGNGRRWSRCLEIRLKRCVVDLEASFPIAASRGVHFRVNGIGRENVPEGNLACDIGDGRRWLVECSRMRCRSCRGYLRSRMIRPNGL